MRNKIFMLMLLLLLFPVNVYAAGSMSISCSPKELKPGETVECSIKGNADVSISAIVTTISVSKNVTLVKFIPAANWSGDDISNGKIDVYTDNEDFVNDFNIGTLKIKINDDHDNGDETIALNNFNFYNLEGESAAKGNASTSITVKSTNNPEPSSEIGLKSLSVTGGMLLYNFDLNRTSYIVQLNNDATTFSITAEPKNNGDPISYVNADTNATINPNNITFETFGGKSQMSIKITVGTGNNAIVYNLAIIKISSSTVSDGLSSLTVGGVNVNLTKNTYDYEVTLSNIDNYQVNATLADTTNYKIANLTFPTTMHGETEFAIVVMPKNNKSGLKSHTYKITVKGKNKPATQEEKPSYDPPSNPTTGSTTTSVIMAIVLILSFTITIYLYKKNIENYN